MNFSFGSSAAAFFFVLDNKEAKPSPPASSLMPLKNNNKLLIPQGLELMSDKFVKALIAASQAAMKNRRIRDALVCF
ncbi:hypothetical protein ASE92_11695 [Pedobacter sp. Leaf41]|uniref:hypothetical protein n=1 Tax=Pedobacter sp. Leaf41 TaxID=1736218 RepID=UPI000702D1AB|nr:hypothetical protein [Pedobacter sp. Leaf41]KQN34270.1 hypothetical protein ASE92_11695 [Pedobacter sp. Leaf41]